MHSIIVPVYNTENKHLRKCIDSIISQIYTDWELILIDDGSDEHTRNIIREYANRDERIHVFYSNHEGVSNARNIGLNTAQGEYVMFVDSDDWIEPDYLQIVERYMSDDADIYIVGITQDFELDDRHLSHSKVLVSPTHIIIYPDELGCQFGYMYRTINLSSACLKTYRTSLLRENNIWFPRDAVVLEDFHFVLSYLQCRPKISLIPFVGYHYLLPVDYNPIKRRGSVDFFPSIHLVLEQFDNTCIQLNFDGYSRKVFLLASSSIIYYVINQSGVDSVLSPFKKIANDSFFIKYKTEMSNSCGRRFRLLSSLLTFKLFGLAYVLNKYI